MVQKPIRIAFGKWEKVLNSTKQSRNEEISMKSDGRNSQKAQRNKYCERTIHIRLKI